MLNLYNGGGHVGFVQWRRPCWICTMAAAMLDLYNGGGHGGFAKLRITLNRST